MRKTILTGMLSLIVSGASVMHAQQTQVTIHADQGKSKISKHIYGHFAEHLGSCVYGGLWVGPESPIPNQKGYRTDVVDALRKLNIPNMRWPGGCFADEYHWMDGIGPRADRPKMVNTNWGGTIEDNSFGTHEFLDLCELIGCEPYISGNMGSGSVEEMAKWVEYMNSDGESPMANLRRQNGREEPWNVKFFGVGNESWGCGGEMTPEYYSDLYRRYATYCRDYGKNKLFKIGSGASDYDYRWTEVLMKNIGRRMHGLSLHYYTVKGWGRNEKGSATQFDHDDYYWTISKALEIEEVLLKHMEIMDRYDKEKRIGLMVDEWGTWFEVEPGTNPGHLFQQNTMRDAFVAALSLHVFHKYTDRIQMTNIAQVANVLQSMVLTKADKMVLTPTYHVFEMFKVHQEAIHLPLDITVKSREIRDRKVDMVNVSASKKEGVTHITLANIDLEADQEVEIAMQGTTLKQVSGRILTAKKINDHNTFDNPNLIAPTPFKGAKISKEKLTVKLPAKSIVVLEVK